MHLEAVLDKMDPNAKDTQAGGSLNNKANFDNGSCKIQLQNTKPKHKNLNKLQPQQSNARPEQSRLWETEQTD